MSFSVHGQKGEAELRAGEGEWGACICRRDLPCVWRTALKSSGTTAWLVSNRPSRCDVFRIRLQSRIHQRRGAQLCLCPPPSPPSDPEQDLTAASQNAAWVSVGGELGCANAAARNSCRSLMSATAESQSRRSVDLSVPVACSCRCRLRSPVDWPCQAGRRGSRGTEVL